MANCGARPSSRQPAASAPPPASMVHETSCAFWVVAPSLPRKTPLVALRNENTVRMLPIQGISASSG